MTSQSKETGKKIKTFEKYFRCAASQNSDVPAELLSEIKQCLCLADQTASTLQESLILEESQRMPGRSLFPKVSSDQDILLVGAIGLAGTIFMANYFRDELITRLPGWMIDDTHKYTEQLSAYPAIEMIKNYDVSAAYPVSEGGLRRVLYQIGKDTLKGYRIDPHTVPINQITIEFCEFYDIDPWRLLSCGCTLLITPKGNALMRELQALKIPAAIIGYTTGDKDKLLIYDDVQSRVNRPEPDGFLSLLIR